jgi:hypothetical protein
MLCFDPVTCYLNWGNEKADIEYSMNYMRRYLGDQERINHLGELGKMFHMFSNSINREILGQDKMRFEKNFKSYSNDQ